MPSFASSRTCRWFTVLAAALCAPPGQARGDAGSKVVLSVGTARLSVAAVEDRLGQLPPFQLQTLGSNAPQIAERFVRQVLVTELLHAEEARRLRLEQTPEARARIDEVLRRALERQLAERLQREEPVTDEQVRRYYAANRGRFETSERIRVWRILVSDIELGRRIIEDAKGPKGVAQWSRHAREHSLDQATRMRRGDLGFVRRDGRTDTPRVRVNAALFAAAQRVADGQLVPEPIAEGIHFAVIWRRGSLPATSRTLEQAADSIRQALLRSQLQDAVDALVRRLRRQHVRKVNADLLAQVSTPLAEFVPGPRPASSAVRPAANGQPPQRRERGLR